MLLTRHYPSIKTRTVRVPVLSGQPERKQRRNVYIYIHIYIYIYILGREKGPRMDDVAPGVAP